MQLDLVGIVWALLAAFASATAYGVYRQWRYRMLDTAIMQRKRVDELLRRASSSHIRRAELRDAQQVEGQTYPYFFETEDPDTVAANALLRTLPALTTAETARHLELEQPRRVTARQHPVDVIKWRGVQLSVWVIVVAVVAQLVRGVLWRLVVELLQHVRSWHQDQIAQTIINPAHGLHHMSQSDYVLALASLAWSWLLSVFGLPTLFPPQLTDTVMIALWFSVPRLLSALSRHGLHIPTLFSEGVEDVMIKYQMMKTVKPVAYVR